MLAQESAALASLTSIPPGASASAAAALSSANAVLSSLDAQESAALASASSEIAQATNTDATNPAARVEVPWAGVLGWVVALGAALGGAVVVL